MRNTVIACLVLLVAGGASGCGGVQVSGSMTYTRGDATVAVHWR